MNKKNLIKLSFGHAFTDVNQGALPIMLAYLQPVFSMTQVQVGMAITAFNITSSIIQPAFGIYSDRFRLIWLMPLGCLLAGLGMAVTGFCPNFYALLPAVLISGIGVAAFHPEGSKFARYASGARKVSGMAIFSVGGNLGVAMGPVLATLFYGLAQLRGSVGFLLINLAVALVLYLAMPVFGGLADAAGEGPEPPGGSKKSWASGKKAFPIPGRVALPLTLVLAIITLRSWVVYGVSTFVPQYYIHQLNTSGFQATLVNFLFLAAGAAGTLIGGPAADRWGMKTVIIISMALQGPLLYLFLHLGGVWSLVCITLTGLALVSTFAVTLVYGQELLPGRVGLASGLMIGFAVGMGGVGTPLIGYIADHWGLFNALRAIMVLPVACLVLAFFLPRDAAAARERGQQAGA